MNSLEAFVDKCLEVFPFNLSGIIYYGSGLRGGNGVFSDKDLVAVFKNYQLDLFIVLRNIVQELEFNVDLPIIFEGEIPVDANDFRVINHGCYFLEVLKRGHVLFGKNVFLLMPKPSDIAIKRSLFEKIIEYAQFFRRVFLESKCDYDPSFNYQLNKRLLKSAYDLLWILENKQCDYGGFLELLRIKIPNLLNAGEWDVIDGLMVNGKISSYSDFSIDFLSARFFIMEKIYLAAKKLVFFS